MYQSGVTGPYWQKQPTLCFRHRQYVAYVPQPAPPVQTAPSITAASSGQDEKTGSVRGSRHPPQEGTAPKPPPNPTHASPYRRPSDQGETAASSKQRAGHSSTPRPTTEYHARPGGQPPARESELPLLSTRHHTAAESTPTTTHAHHAPPPPTTPSAPHSHEP
jgi:hypothetical protein